MTPSERILAAFDDLTDDARLVVAETLERLHAPFLSSLGSSLTYSPKMAQSVLRLALKRVSWDGSASLADRLGDNEPWLTVKQCLAEALDAVPAVVEGGSDR